MLFNNSMENLRINFKSFLPIWAITTFIQLLNVGVHVGHSIENTTPYAAWMILGQRQGSVLINLFKFIYMFRAGFFILQGVIKRRNPVWFVNLDVASDAIVKTAALNSGEYWVTNYWIHGLLSNYKRLKKAGRVNISTPRIFWKKKHNYFYKNFDKWGFTRATWPRTIFVSNVLKSYNVCHEALCLKVPTIGIVDTNSPQKYVTVAVPGNDESFSSLSYYNNLISMFILYSKFSMVYSWYLNRASKVSINFKEWIANRILNKTSDKKIRPNLAFYRVNAAANLYGFNLPFYQNLWKTQELLKTRINALWTDEVSLDFLKFKLQSHFSNTQFFLLKLKDLLAFSVTFLGTLKNSFRFKKPKLPAKKFLLKFFLQKKLSARKMKSSWTRALSNKFRVNLTKYRINPQKAFFTFLKRWLAFSRTQWASTKLYYYYRIFLYNYLVASLKYRFFFSASYFAKKRKYKRKVKKTSSILQSFSSNNYIDLRRIGGINRLFFLEHKQTVTTGIGMINKIRSSIIKMKNSTQKIEFFFLFKEVRKEKQFRILPKRRTILTFKKVDVPFLTNQQGVVFGTYFNRSLLATQILRFYNSAINLGLFKTQGSKQLRRKRLLNITYV